MFLPRGCFSWCQLQWKYWLEPYLEAYAELLHSMEQIKIVITIWLVQPVRVVWKHVFLSRPQRDNYCQLNYSACSACVFWLCASDPLTLSSSMRWDLQLPSSFPLYIFASPPMFNELKWAKFFFLNVEKRTCECMFWFLCVKQQNDSIQNAQKNPGCLTETHTNTAIIGGRKLWCVAVWQQQIPLVHWNKTLCCYVKVSTYNCSGYFWKIHYLYIPEFFSGRAYSAAIAAGSFGTERCLTKALYHSRAFNYCPFSWSGQNAGSKHHMILNQIIQPAALAPVHQLALCDLSLSDFDFCCIPMTCCRTCE